MNGESDQRHVPLFAALISLSIACAFVALITTVCLIVVCRRKSGPAAQPQGPAHWSTTVTVTPECRPRDLLMAGGGTHISGHGHLQGANGMGRSGARSAQGQQPTTVEQDRMALIAFADGNQVKS